MPQPKKGQENNFQKWADAHFDNAKIKEVGRLTNTDIKKDTEGLVRFINSFLTFTNEFRSP